MAAALRAVHGRVRGAGAEQSRGFALLVVIMIMLIVSFLASQLIMQVRTELRITANHKARTSSRFLSEAGLKLGLFHLLDKPLVLEEEGPQVFLQGFPYQEQLSAGRVEYSVVSESGKIDLNSAPRQLLELFLQYEQVEPEQIQIIIDSLLDWRDTDNMTRFNGAEQETYESLPIPYIPRNGRIEEPGEFFLVHGTEELAGRFDADQVFTRYNTTGKINFNSLTTAMLDFLVLGDQARKDAYREAQKLYGTLNAGHAMEILGEERFGELQRFLAYQSGDNRYYTLEGTGRAGETVMESTAEEGPETEQTGRQLPGLRTRALIKFEGTRVQYLTWMEQYV